MALQDLSLSELSWQLVPIYGTKAANQTITDIRKTDRFTTASNVSQQAFLTVEQILQEQFNGVEFVELSPLQPLGLNCFLTDADGKKSIATVRGQEVLADSTTALFLETYRRNHNFVDDLRLATNVRTVRAQVFTEESRFLPHFKVFAEVSVGRQKSTFGEIEIMTIAQHLADELNALLEIRRQVPNHIASIHVYLSDLVILRSRVLRDKHNNGNIVSLVHDYWQDSGLPAHLAFDDTLVDNLRGFGFIRGLKVLEMFKAAFEPIAPHSPDLHYHFDLSRSDGANYYRHIAYKVTLKDDSGPELPLADGGSNDWGKDMSYNKQVYTVSSGIGTELLIQHFLELA